MFFRRNEVEEIVENFWELRQKCDRLEKENRELTQENNEFRWNHFYCNKDYCSMECKTCGPKLHVTVEILEKKKGRNK